MLAIVVALCCAVGCTESVMTYTTFSGWSGGEPPEQAVFSGTPAQDTAAYGASEMALSESDWKTLEKIAPRPMWERIGELRKMFRGDRKEIKPPKALPKVVKIPDLPVQKLPSGQVQMVYHLQNYGGVRVSSSYTGGISRRVIKLSPADLAPLVGLLNTQLAGKGKVIPLVAQNSIVITCDEDVKDSILRTVATIDVPLRQVEITARIFEVSHDFDFQFGAKALIEHMSSSGSKQSLVSNFSTKGFLDAIGSGTGFQGAVLRVLKIFESSGITVDVSFQALADMGLIKVVSSPRMTVTIGQTGHMLAGQELPIASARLAGDSFVSEKTTYKPVGVQLYITPLAVGDDSVKMHVSTIVSAVAGFAPTREVNGLDTEPLLNPIIDTREAETTVTVKDGRTMVMGGMRLIRTITRERKLPGLGDIVLLEWFFKSHRSQNNINDLYFFVTPRIIR